MTSVHFLKLLYESFIAGGEHGPVPKESGNYRLVVRKNEANR